LNLPYWNWSVSPTLPVPFRSPAAASNPLYEPRRQFNDGSSLTQEHVVIPLRNCLELTDFDADSLGFGFALQAPHGSVHTEIGGEDGIMSTRATSANDPIFWLHHCNVDRLWDYWINLGGGRANPSDPEFLNQTFSYVDENGSVVTHRVEEILYSSQLGYRYDNVPNPSPILQFAAEPPRPRVMMAPMGLGHAVIEAGQEPAVGLPIATSAKPEDAPRKPLGFRTETVKLAATPPPMRAFAPAPGGNVPARAARPPRYVLRVEDIKFDAIPNFTYGVYLNVPEGQEPSEQTQDYLAGTINFFARSGEGGPRGHGHGDAAKKGGTFTQSFDVTALVERLKAKGQWKGDENIRVDLRPLVRVSPTGRQAETFRAAEASSQAANVSRGLIQIREIPR